VKNIIAQEWNVATQSGCVPKSSGAQRAKPYCTLTNCSDNSRRGNLFPLTSLDPPS